MRSRKTKLISLLLSAALVCTMVFGSVGSAAAATQSEIASVYNDTADSLYEIVTNPACDSIGGDWVLYGMAIAGYDMSDEYVAKYQASVEAALSAGYRGQSGILHDRKYTEYSRVVVTYGELGLDPTDVNGVNLLEFLADFDAVAWQGINGPIWALQALDAGDFDIPSMKGKTSNFAGISGKPVENVTTRQKLIDYILDNQLADGGWALSGKISDPDLTGMALAALAPYQSQKKVKSSINDGIECLSKLQNSDGTYSTFGDKTSESCAQVIRGLVRCGVNPNADSRFKKSGKTVVDGLLSFYDEKVHGFRHVNEAGGGYEAVVDQMATEQAYYALAEYKAAVPDQTTISAVKKSGNDAVKVTWKKAAVASGYQVIIATDASFKNNVKKYTVKKGSTTSKKVEELKSGKTYYVKVRAYKTVNGKKIYGAYSKSKKVKL